MLLKKNVCPPIGTNTYLIVCEETRKAAIIDPSTGASVFLNSQRDKFESLEGILITHSHWDHIGEVNLISKEFNAKVYAHKLDEGNLKNPGSDGIPMIGEIESIKVDHFIKDREILKFGSLEIEVIHTPGHSFGSCCFYLASEKVVFTGDTLFCNGIGNLSFPTSQQEMMRDSLKKLLALPIDTKVFPGHGRWTDINHERDVLTLLD